MWPHSRPTIDCHTINGQILSIKKYPLFTENLYCLNYCHFPSLSSARSIKTRPLSPFPSLSQSHSLISSFKGLPGTLFPQRSRVPIPRSLPCYYHFCLRVAANLDDTMSASVDGDARVQGIFDAIRVVPDFPKPGIMFQDITTLLLDHKAFRDCIDIFVERYKDKNISVVAGIEARGFIFGPPIALAIGAKFVPIRKPKKLPGEVISEEYALEYGTDRIEMHVGAVQPGDRTLVVDDLIATGGTLSAAMRLLERVGAEVVECACVIELPELKGRERLGGKPLFILVESA